MKLTKLYSNLPKFKSVIFSERINIILGEGNNLVDNNSHNLGKTTVVQLIDYLLLKDITKDKNHFLSVNSNKFKGSLFFLEIKLGENNFFTIKRIVGENKISIKIHETQNSDFTKEKNWDFDGITLKKAKNEINNLFNLKFNLEYRKILKFIIRNQDSYNFEFKKNEVKDKDWKPYLLKLLGYSSEKLEKVYKLEEENKKISDQLTDGGDDFYKRLEEKKIQKRVLENQILKLEKEISEHDYYTIDDSVNRDLVEEINNVISSLNIRKYNLSFDIENIKQSLKIGENNIDLDRIAIIFDETNTYFPEKMKKDYEALLKFNKEIFIERRNSLEKNLKLKQIELESVDVKLINYNLKQKEAFKILESNKIIEKIITHKDRVNYDKIELIKIEKDLESMRARVEQDKKIRETTEKIEELTSAISLEINDTSNVLKEKIVDYFAESTMDILYNVEGIFLIYANKNGKPEFEMKLNSLKTGLATSESKGHNYNKYMKCLFDISIVRAYHDLEYNYFDFLIHDGALESSDPKVKELYFKYVNKICDKYNLQYITTAISNEITDIVHLIKPNEICLRLNDASDYSGTLFGERF